MAPPTVYIDDTPFPTDATDLAGIIRSARPKVDPTGRLIVEVRLDGDVVEADDLDEVQNRPLDAEEVQLVTAEPYALARTALLEVQDTLPAAREAQQEAAELLTADDTETALQHVQVALGVWQQAQMSVQNATGLLEMPLDDITVDDQAVSRIIEQLAEQLRQLREQLLASDWLGLADTLGYELEETVGRWS
ncbi:MAG: hypothetical protein OER86_04695, partial [Phycisphaerae bacterium]|nr:hypothetical protein [Phycisphaerae bacterium]